MRRDRLTFAMMIGIPLMQLILFGFAINFEPAPSAHRGALRRPQRRSPAPCCRALRNSDYFDVIRRAPRRKPSSTRCCARARSSSCSRFPQDFSRRLLRGERPRLLVEADATDPAATGNALAALQELAASVLDRDLKGPLAGLRGTPGPPVRAAHPPRYNPEVITQYNIVPGLMGVVLTMTMVMITALAITRETRARHHGEPARHARPADRGDDRQDRPLHPRRLHPGRPHPGRGALPVSTCPSAGSIAAPARRHVPLHRRQPRGRHHLLHHRAATSSRPCRCRSSSSCPRILLSGFMFPFRGMPDWAQAIGELLPLTHFLRIVRGILLKGNGLADISQDLWPILALPRRDDDRRP